jgi:hypothetical protein
MILPALAVNRLGQGEPNGGRRRLNLRHTARLMGLNDLRIMICDQPGPCCPEGPSNLWFLNRYGLRN